MVAGVLHSFDHALKTARPEAARHNDARDGVKKFVGANLFDLLGADPPDLDVPVEVQSGMQQGFFNRDVGILKVNVFAYHGDGQGLFWLVDSRH